MTSAAFTIDAAGFTDTLYELVVQGRWDHAATLLRNHTTLDLQAATDLLSGRLQISSNPRGGYKLTPTAPGTEHALQAYAAHTYRPWLNDRYDHGNHRSLQRSVGWGPNSRRIRPFPELPRASQAWRLHHSGTFGQIDMSDMSRNYINGPLGRICRRHGCSQIEGYVLLLSSDPDSARVNTYRTPDSKGLEDTHWALFHPEERPIPPPWWPDLIATTETQWWQQFLHPQLPTWPALTTPDRYVPTPETFTDPRPVTETPATPSRPVGTTSNPDGHNELLEAWLTGDADA